MKPEIKERIEKIKRGQVPEGDKKTKLGIVPSDWEKVKLGIFLIECNEKNKDLQIKNILSINNKLGFVSQEKQFGKIVASKDLSKYKIIEKNYIAYNPSRINVGSIAIYNRHEKGIVSPMYIVFKTNDNLDNTYFIEFIQ